MVAPHQTSVAGLTSFRLFIPYPPVPDRAAFCGLPVALSVTEIAAERAPVANGLNVTLIVQLDEAASEVPQVLVSAKSLAFVPVTAMLVMVNAVVPSLVRVTVLTALLTPTVTVPKATESGESSAVVPVPLSETFCVPPIALSETAIVADDSTPVVLGVNVTLIVQLAAAASEVPQVLVSA